MSSTPGHQEERSSEEGTWRATARKYWRLTSRQSLLLLSVLGLDVCLHLAASDIHRVVDDLRGHGAISIALSIALFLGLALFLGARSYERIVEGFRLDATWRRVPPIDVLILPVSLPGSRRVDGSAFSSETLGKSLASVLKLAENASISELKGLIERGMRGDGGAVPTVDALGAFADPRLCLFEKQDQSSLFYGFAWATGFKTVDAFMQASPNRLRAIHLVPSGETEDAAKTYYRPILAKLVERRVKTTWSVRNGGAQAPDAPAVKVVVHAGSDYHDFNKLQAMLAAIVDAEEARHSAGGSHGEFRAAIDVTGGTSAFSGAAAIQATRRQVLYSYIPMLSDDDIRERKPFKDPLCYDVVASMAKHGE